MARTYDALIRAEQIRKQDPDTQAGDAELLERIGSLEEGLRELALQLPRELTDAEERLMSSVSDAIRALEERRAQAERKLASELETRIELLQRRLTRTGLVLGALLLWILLRQ